MRTKRYQKARKLNIENVSKKEKKSQKEDLEKYRDFVKEHFKALEYSVTEEKEGLIDFVISNLSETILVHCHQTLETIRDIDIKAFRMDANEYKSNIVVNSKIKLRYITMNNNISPEAILYIEKIKEKEDIDYQVLKMKTTKKETSYKYERKKDKENTTSLDFEYLVTNKKEKKKNSPTILLLLVASSILFIFLYLSSQSKIDEQKSNLATTQTKAQINRKIVQTNTKPYTPTIKKEIKKIPKEEPKIEIIENPEIIIPKVIRFKKEKKEEKKDNEFIIDTEKILAQKKIEIERLKAQKEKLEKKQKKLEQEEERRKRLEKIKADREEAKLKLLFEIEQGL